MKRRVVSLHVLRKSDYEIKHIIPDKFPFMGTDEERVFYKILFNTLLEQECKNYKDYYNDFRISI